MGKIIQFSIVIFLSVAFLLWGCTFIPPLGGKRVDSDHISDGIYEGSYRSGPVKVVASVNIKNGRIIKIKLLKHTTWKGKPAETIIPNRIIQKQSTRVDAVSGATISSRVIMNAVQDAINKASKNI